MTLATDKLNSRLYKSYKKFLPMLVLATNTIHRQGGGCVIEKYGVAYKYGKNVDTIAALVGASNIKMSAYGPIEGEDCKYLVAQIGKKYGFALDYTPERECLLGFLMALQACHDDAFCPYKEVDDRMGKFNELIKELEISIKENIEELKDRF